MKQASDSIMTGIRTFSAHLPLSSLLLPCYKLSCNPGSSGMLSLFCLASLHCD